MEMDKEVPSHGEKSQSDVPLQSEEEWHSTSSSVLHRHFSTIGIGDVFLKPPPSEDMLPKFYLNADNSLKTEGSSSRSRSSWEIIGRIKSVPDDFVVREISLSKAQEGCPSYPKVADISFFAGSDAKTSMKQVDKDTNATNPKDPETIAEVQGNEKNSSVTKSKSPLKSEINTTERKEDMPGELELSPLEIIEKILKLVVLPDGISVDEILTSLADLQAKAKAYVQGSQSFDASDFVWIPPFSVLESNNESLMQLIGASGGVRGKFHRTLKVAFPLLCSESVDRKDKEPTEETKTESGTKTHWIKVSVDSAFFGLLPMLYQAGVDLEKLYLFRNRGCVVTHSENREQHSGRKRPRTTTAGHCHDDGSRVFLHLRKDLKRDERREIHQIILKGCRDFETSTDPAVPIPSLNGDCIEATEQSNLTNETTAAIIVKWSKQAYRIAYKKLQKQSTRSSGKFANNSNCNVLCVMKKYQKEHLTAIQHLTSGLRCRQSDIGLAGIKDMQAITYQFCTVRDRTIDRVRNANSYLKQRGIELGSFREVDWSLAHGSLEGNQFEIIVRDLSRVKLHHANVTQGIEEVFVPCNKSHASCMVERIRASGFINFYGEQRLGAAGRTSEVGVRSFDIGRAMLQHHFEEAIDLLMQGRLVCVGDNKKENEEVRKARQVWKESQGDAVATLKALPRGEAMARERTVLKGIKRYGQSDPLSALKCLHFGVRQFYVNAFQSYVWNEVATERIKRFGAKVMVGDLYVKSHGEKNDVHVVENVSSVTLDQVVLPLPGYNIKYPSNEIGEVYKTIMIRERVHFEKDAPLEATAKGSYRHLIAFAHDLKAEFNASEKDNNQSDATNDTNIESMKLLFSLKSGSYATMMLREMMLTTVTRDNTSVTENNV